MTAEPKRHGNTRIFPAALDPKAVGIVQRLNDQGYESYLVGGCVRDLLLGHIPKDFDVSTAARPRQIRRVFRNCRIIGRRFKLAHVHFGEQIIEVATFRRPPGARDESEGGNDEDDDDDNESSDDLLITRDNDYGTAEQDALRRDFTINALLYDVQTDEVLDWVGGVDDIEQRLLRAIGDPRVRLAEDPVRMLRAVKFASRLDLGFEAELDAAMSECAPLIEQSAPPRVLEEIFKLLTCGHAETALTLLTRFGLFAPLLPELAEHWAGRSDELVAVGRALDHLDGARRRLPNGFLLAALCHDPWRATLEGDGVQEAQIAARDLLTPLALRMSVPRRDIAIAKQLLTLQARFERKRSGRRPRLGDFLGKPSTQQGLEFLYLRSLVDPELAELHADWTQRLAELHPEAVRADADPKAEADDDGEGRRPKRRRRRRGGRNRRRRDESRDDEDDADDRAAPAPRAESRREPRERSARETPPSTSEPAVAASNPSDGGATSDSNPAPSSAAAEQRGLGGRLKKWVRKVLGGPEPETDGSASAPPAVPLTPHTESRPPARDAEAPAADASDASSESSSRDASSGDENGAGDGEGKPRRRRRSRGGRRRRGGRGAAARKPGDEQGESADSEGEDSADRQAATDGDGEQAASESSAGSSRGGRSRRRGGRRRGGGKRSGGGASEGEGTSEKSGESRAGGEKTSSSRGSGKKRSGGSKRGDKRSDKRGDKRPSRDRGGVRDEFDPGGHPGTDDISSKTDPQHDPEDVEDVFDW